MCARGRPAPTAATWRLALAPGLAFGANIALFFTAITKTSIAHAEFITALTPLVLLPAGAFFFGERPNWNALRWGLISIVGVSLVLFFGPEQGASSVSGDLMMIGVIQSLDDVPVDVEAGPCGRRRAPSTSWPA